MPRTVPLPSSSWQHQLNPRISRAGWTQEQTQKLFDLQRQFGNKWSQIAQALPGRTDNITKNFFYAFVRKNITKINAALRQVPKTSPLGQIRSFDSDFTSKLILVSDGHFQDKIRLNSLDLRDSAREILNGVITLEGVGKEQGGIGEELEGLVERMQNFRLNSKKKKQSKKVKDHQRFLREESEQLTALSQQITPGRTYWGSEGRGKGGVAAGGGGNVVGGVSNYGGLQEEMEQDFLSEDKVIDTEGSAEPTVDSRVQLPPSPPESPQELPQNHQLEPFSWTPHHRSYTRLWDCLREQLVFGPAVEEEWSFGEESSLHLSFLAFPEGEMLGGGVFGRERREETAFQAQVLGEGEEDLPL